MSSLLANIEDTLEYGDCFPILHKIFDRRIELCKQEIDYQLNSRMTEFVNYYKLLETQTVQAIFNSTIRWNNMECMCCNVDDLYRFYDLTSKEIESLYGIYYEDRYDPYVIARIEKSDDPNDMIVINFQNSLKWMDDNEEFKNHVTRILYKIDSGIASMYHTDSALRSYTLVFTESFRNVMNSYIEPELKKYCHLD